MGALELSRQYFLKTAAPVLEHDFPALYPRLAVGLVGNGSERFGFDDALSQDHDWGVNFYLWILEQDRDQLSALNAWKQRLLETHPPAHISTHSPYGLPPSAMTVGDFYYQMLGCAQAPQQIEDWIRIPEESLALATNGEVWLDGPGSFTEVQSELLNYYPDDLRRKRMAAKCMTIAQTGQYNFWRMAQRGDWVATQLTLARFSEAVMALAFMLNKTYRPYYKWLYRKCCTLPVLGVDLKAPLQQLALATVTDAPSLAAAQEVVTAICDLLISELHRQALTTSDDWFLATHGEELQNTIQTPRLKALPAQYEI